MYGHLRRTDIRTHSMSHLYTREELDAAVEAAVAKKEAEKQAAVEAVVARMEAEKEAAVEAAIAEKEAENEAARQEGERYAYQCMNMINALCIMSERRAYASYRGRCALFI